MVKTTVCFNANGKHFTTVTGLFTPYCGCGQPQKRTKRFKFINITTDLGNRISQKETQFITYGSSEWFLQCEECDSFPYFFIPNQTLTPLEEREALRFMNT